MSLVSLSRHDCYTPIMEDLSMNVLDVTPQSEPSLEPDPFISQWLDLSQDVIFPLDDPVDVEPNLPPPEFSIDDWLDTDTDVELTPTEDIEEIAERVQAERCGSWHSYVRPLDGGLSHYQYHCDNHRLCPLCRKRKVSELMERADDARFEVLIPKSDWESTARRLRRKKIDYMRVEKDDAYLVLTDKREDSGLLDFQFVDRESLWDRLDNAIQNLPRRSRISGKLGKKRIAVAPGPLEESGIDEDIVNITVPVICADAPAKIRLQAWREAVDATALLDPKDHDSLIHALKTRLNAYRKALIALGVTKIGTSARQERVRITHIRWRENIGIIRTPSTLPDGKDGPLHAVGG